MRKRAEEPKVSVSRESALASNPYEAMTANHPGPSIRIPSFCWNAMARTALTYLRAESIFDTASCENVPAVEVYRRARGINVNWKFADLVEGKSRTVFLRSVLTDIWDILECDGYSRAAERILEIRSELDDAISAMERVTQR